jgi:hypothetical protein
VALLINPNPTLNTRNNTAQHRVIILGASNVVRCLPTVIETARNTWGRPLEIMAAIGHGRSYGLTTTVLGRTLPGILQCDLWQDWQEREQLPTAALITDIGNDILFGATPSQIAAWVRECLRQIVERCDHIIMTELPLESVKPIGRQRFLLLRSVLFPRSRLTWDQGLSHGIELNDRVRELAREFDATLVKPKREWYGFDPIHIMMPQQKQAWRYILEAWSLRELSLHESSLRELVSATTNHDSRPAWRLARPKYRKLLGIVQRREQPSRSAADGTTLSVY